MSTGTVIAAALALAVVLFLLAFRRALHHQAIRLPDHRIAALPKTVTVLLELSLKAHLRREEATWTTNSPVQRRLDLFEALHRTSGSSGPAVHHSLEGHP